jgi:uncharacterized protein
MVNYVVDPAALEPLIPTGTEFDPWQDRVYVSIVGFRFLRTRLLGIPVPFHRNFDEVNLRFYVRRRVNGAWRRGVAFVKEIVPRRAIAFVARSVYNENFVRMPMRSSLTIPGEVRYEWWHAGAWASVSAHVVGEATSPGPDAEEAFISEHSWGYTRQPDGSTTEYEVEHPPWKVWRCEAPALTCLVGQLYGERFAKFLSGPPVSAFLADGSSVVVRRGVRLR